MRRVLWLLGALGCAGAPAADTGESGASDPVPSSEEGEPPVDSGVVPHTGESGVGWDSGDSEPFAGHSRSCDSRVEYLGAAGSVYVASEITGWEEGDWIALEPSAEGLAVDLPLYDLAGPGTYCYKLIVDGEWILDPAHSYRAYCDGVENSGMRVPDCTLPLVEIQAVEADGRGLSTRLSFLAGADGVGPGELRATLEHDFESSPVDAAWSDRWELELELFDLAPGKYTLRIEAEDAEGRAAESLLLPFWVEEEEPFTWEDALLYMIMIDRFRNGDPGNDPVPVAEAYAPGDWMGGDLRGVTEAIEAGYFDALGVSALWLTPFNQGAEGAYIAGDGVHLITGYHGYWPIEPRTIDPRLGSAEDLKEMVAAAHARGIRVMMDAVVNHVHEEHPYYRDHPEWFNDGCICGTAGCDWTAEALTCLFADYMPDIDWTDSQASERFIEDVLWWLETYDLDGARIDAVKHVDAGAVFNLVTRIEERFETAGVDYYLDGETAMGWNGDDLADNASEYGTINEYMGEGGLDGQFDFVLYHAVVDNVFVRDSKGMIHLDVWTGYSQSEYLPGSIMTPYFGSHDTSRLISMIDYRGQDAEHPDELSWHKWESEGLPEEPGEDEPYERMRTALCWLYTIPGAPMLYQGDEYGEFGGGDPDNRHPHREEALLSERELALLEHTRGLGELRQASRALRRGDYAGIGSTEDVMAFRRLTPEGDLAIVGINRQPWTSTAWVDVTGLGLAEGLHGDALGSGGLSVGGSSAELTVPARSCTIILP